MKDAIVTDAVFGTGDYGQASVRRGPYPDGIIWLQRARWEPARL